jgi:capsule polysaccharide modification protein KpsS
MGSSKTESDVLKAFKNRTVFQATDETLQAYLEALCNQAIFNDYIRHRAIIQGNTLTHVLMANFLRRVSRQNTRWAWLVTIVAMFSLIASIIQAWAALQSIHY